MVERIMEVEADSLEEARKKAESQVPEDLRIVSEEILSDGKPKSMMGVADTIEAAFEEAESKLPPAVEVVERQQIHKPRFFIKLYDKGHDLFNTKKDFLR